ncbi:FAD-binding monooxygenase [Streptosporangium fragile]|uniref:FAD-binding monooxygenase n=2 Tax=Streptosporangium fragile TaxID=46186 RepID=A0ABN3W7P7_9ACTN
MHILLDAGRTQLDRWFPGFSDGMLSRGAVLADVGSTAAFYLNGHRKVPVPGNEVISSTRPFLESYVHSRLAECGNVVFRKGRARGLRFDSGRVSGVLFSGGDDADGSETLSSDLVVDAMGRSSRLGEWLAGAGWQPPALERLHVDLGYATALFTRDPADSGMLAVHSLSLPDSGMPRLASMAAVEGNRWIVVVTGYARERPVRDTEDFLERCRQDPSGHFGKAVGLERMLGGVATYRHPDNRRRAFSRLSRFPGGLVALGDSVASFNPIYGQGMSSAGLHAACLDEYLRGGPSLSEPARDYFENVDKVVAAAWQTSAASDALLPHSSATPTRQDRAAKVVMDAVLRASLVDREVHRRFLDVANMRAHPNTLLRPGTLLRVARRWRTDVSPV